MQDRSGGARPPPETAPAGEATVIRPRGTLSGALRPGAILGHTYAIEAVLGRGALGEVYRARHVELGTSHAIKVIAPSLAGDPKAARALVEEARRLAQVRHDAVVAYEGLFRDEEGRRFLVMEFVEGPSLRAVLAARRLEPDEVMRLRTRLAEGLAAVHAHGLIHRNISPDAIILPQGDAARAKLTDFGFATTPEARDPTLIGTNLAARFAFASPEQLGLFEGHLDSRSDIYSLGLVLAAAAIGFGRTLDMGVSPAAAIAARQKPPDLTQVPVGLRPVIAPLLMPRPEDRPASLRALIEAPAAAPRKLRGYRPALLAAAGAAGLALAGVLALLLLRGVPVPPPSGDELRAQLAAATSGYDCASLNYTVMPDRSVRLAGHVASAVDLARLREAVAAIPGIGSPRLAVGVMGRPHCEVAALLGPLVPEAGRDGPALSFAGTAAEAFVGERPSLNVRAPGFDGYLYIDYFDSGSGQVLHLFPNPRDRFNLRPWRNHFVLFRPPVWTICGNVGRQLISLLALAKPLAGSPRPNVEPAATYLAAVRQALAAAPRGRSAAALLFFDLRASPPWVNREAACPGS